MLSYCHCSLKFESYPGTPRSYGTISQSLLKMQFSKTKFRAGPAPPNTGTSLYIGQIPHNFIRMNKGFSIQKSILASALMSVLLTSVTLVITLTPLYTTQSVALLKKTRIRVRARVKVRVIRMIRLGKN